MSGNNPTISDEAAHEQVNTSHSYHRPKFQETMDNMGYLRQIFAEAGHEVVKMCPPSRERSLALTALDDSNMWAIASLARHEPEGTEVNTTSHPDSTLLAYAALKVRAEFPNASHDEIIDMIKERMAAGPVDPQPYPLTHDGEQKS